MSKPFQINILLDVAEDDNFDQCKALLELENIASEFRDELDGYHEVTVTQVEVTDLDAWATAGGTFVKQGEAADLCVQATAVEMHARDGEDLRNRIGTPAAAVAVGQNLWVAVYEHKYGMDTFACTTRLAAEILREGVADQFWEAEMGDLPRPSDSEELADAYFDEMGSHGEFFTIHETTLRGG